MAEHWHHGGSVHLAGHGHVVGKAFVDEFTSADALLEELADPGPAGREQLGGSGRLGTHHPGIAELTKVAGDRSGTQVVFKGGP